MIDISTEHGLSSSAEVTLSHISETQTLPVFITAKDDTLNLNDWAKQNLELINSLKHQYGAVLFRGFGITTAQAFTEVITTTSCEPMDNYLERQLSRDRVSGNVFTSTAHPKEGEIFLHNEQSFNLNFPRNIYFNCHVAASAGGCTPLADTRKIFNRIPEDIRARFIEQGFMYNRNFMKFMYVDWPWAFQTEVPEEVEQYCNANQIKFNWTHPNDMINLSTSQIRPMVARHPVTNEHCWFNHCLAFNVNNLAANMQAMIRSSFKENEYPYHTYFGDGSPIESDVIHALQDAYKSEQVRFDWQVGDLLMVDNIAVSHGRDSFEGERLVLTAMSHPILWSDVQLAPPAFNV